MVDALLLLGHNNGPPLDDEHVPEWGRGGFGTYFEWRAAHRKVWKSIGRDVAMRRLARAESIGLTYEEYTIELLDTGRYLQKSESRIAEIMRKRKKPARR
ncbi:hypothetical protein BH10PSE7_BH10PSE7_21710 [soil metagenome]